MDWLPNQIKLFRALLYCYPTEFRHEYGSEMEQLFADRLQSESVFRLWLESLADVIVNAPKEHGNILISDLRYGARVLAAAPGFTIIALLVIALGIGSTTAIFSLVNAVLLRSLPYGHPEKLVYLWSPNSSFQGVPPEMAPNVPDFYDWQRLSHSFSSVTMLRIRAVNIVRDNSANRVSAAFVTGNFFQTLEAAPELGRSFTADDDRPGHEHVVIISQALWQSQFGSDPHSIGKRIRLNREQYTVVGVMPKEFGYPFNGDIPYVHSEQKQTDLWLPLAYNPNQKTDRTNFESGDAAIGRLRDGVSALSAQDELKAIELRLNPLYPEMWRGFTALTKPLIATIVGPVEAMLWLLLGAVSLVLLIAVSNVANLLLARVTARAHEMGIRTALGAERGRIIRQLLTESLLLSCTGGVLGIALAYAVVQLLVHLNPGDIPRFDTASVDNRVLFLSVALSVITGILCGIAPALFASKAGVNHLLKQGGIRGAIGTTSYSRHLLIVVEVALSVILLAGSGLLIRSYLQLQAVNPGFSQTALTFTLNLDERFNKPELRAAFYKNFLQKLQSIPGVNYAGASNSTPLSHYESVTFVEVRGFGKSKEMLETRSVTPAYRQALGTPLLQGRDFDSHDVNSKTPVAIVNQAFVKTYFHGRDPLQQQVRLGIFGDSSGALWSTVVGVVGDIRHLTLEQPAQPQIFQPADYGDNFAIRSTLPAAQIINQAREALRSLDSALALDSVHTMSERISENNARRRFQTTLLTGFAGIAVVLALAGIYGLMSYTVKQRTAEIGVRLAIGSPRSRVLSLILAQGLRLTAIGLLLGLIGAFALTRLISSWLFGVHAFDPLTFVAVPIFVLAVACCACLIPAWNATRIDPVQALRQE